MKEDFNKELNTEVIRKVRAIARKGTALADEMTKYKTIIGTSELEERRLNIIAVADCINKRLKKETP